jgi:hypothetical protein
VTFLSGYPVVMNYKTMYNYALDESDPEYKGPFNEVACVARLFTPADKAVVTPNSDTPYCMFWIDVRDEPVVLDVPEIEPERFYHHRLIDLYTHNFAYVGTLARGHGAGDFLVVGPDWSNPIPDGIDDVLQSESGLAFIVTRTQLFGPDDLQKVEAIQKGYGLQTLSEFTESDSVAVTPMPNLPAWDEGAQFDGRFFGFLDVMMDFLVTPAPGDKALWAELAHLGIGTDAAFSFSALPADLQEAMEEGVKKGLAEVEAFIEKNSRDPLMSGKLFGTRSFLEESAAKYFELDRIDLLRFVAAHAGLYGNSAAEALYPTYFTDADGQPLDASALSYTLTFGPEDLPPMKSFWSVSMYDGKTQLFIDNPLDLYLVNSSMRDQLQREADGSLVLHVGKESRGPELESNWLPAPDGPFYLVMRLVRPRRSGTVRRMEPTRAAEYERSKARVKGSINRGFGRTQRGGNRQSRPSDLSRCRSGLPAPRDKGRRTDERTA